MSARSDRRCRLNALRRKLLGMTAIPAGGRERRKPAA